MPKMTLKRNSLTLATLFVLIATPALAHTGAGSASGFSAGFGHPIGGLDHILAMVAVGILAAQMGGRSLWLVPLAFLTMMIVGGLFGVAGVPLPLVELGIVGSIVVLGGVIAFGWRMSAGAAMVLVGALAIFHGHAHGTEMPVSVSGIEYGLGFAAATALLHGMGIALGLGATKLADKAAPALIRIGGGAIALAGVALAIG